MKRYVFAVICIAVLAGCGEDSTSRVEYGVQGTASIPIDENSSFSLNPLDESATMEIMTDGEGNNVLNVSCNDCVVTVDYSDNTDNSSNIVSDNNNTDTTTPQQVVFPIVVDPVVVDKDVVIVDRNVS